MKDYVKEKDLEKQIFKNYQFNLNIIKKIYNIFNILDLIKFDQMDQ